MTLFWVVILVIAIVVLVSQFNYWRKCRHFNKSAFGSNPYGSKKFEDEESGALLKIIVAIIAIAYAVCKLW